VYLVSCPQTGVAKVGRWSGKLSKLRGRYRTYYPNPRIWAVRVHAPKDVEKALKDLACARGLAIDDADTKRRRELVVRGSEIDDLFVAVATGGDRKRVADIS